MDIIVTYVNYMIIKYFLTGMSRDQSAYFILPTNSSNHGIDVYLYDLRMCL
jgi:hypothetical protein